MSWVWRFETEDGGAAALSGSSLSDSSLPEPSSSEPFPTQSDAETWLGETWRELLAAGVQQVVLQEAGHKVYGPMSLRPVD
ncbi:MULTISPECIES: hypothetical protein [unclassified Frankia]|uniref:hypothetical protein n=1 Tax=unclassified Frankia TaxID=2632575 RepID=UPI001EF68E66|nr:MULTISPECIES: hypothetical protein [unclassified Frankia]